MLSRFTTFREELQYAGFNADPAVLTMTYTGRKLFFTSEPPKYG